MYIFMNCGVHSVLVSTLLTYIKHERRVIVRVVVFNATFNNILVIFWQKRIINSVKLEENMTLLYH
jgi:hypothetical protein